MNYRQGQRRESHLKGLLISWESILERRNNGTVTGMGPLMLKLYQWNRSIVGDDMRPTNSK